MLSIKSHRSSSISSQTTRITFKSFLKTTRLTQAKWISHKVQIDGTTSKWTVSRVSTLVILNTVSTIKHGRTRKELRHRLQSFKVNKRHQSTADKEEYLQKDSNPFTNLNREIRFNKKSSRITRLQSTRKKIFQAKGLKLFLLRAQHNSERFLIKMSSKNLLPKKSCHH